jgi:class 3 adenylate cyclase
MHNKLITSFKVFESISELDKLEEKDQAILFTDVKSSSKLWNIHKDGMFDALKEHEKRMESTVSEAGELAFSFTDSLDKSQEEKIVKYLEDNNFSMEIIEYRDKCYSGKRKRSGRLLSELQLHTCEPLSKLKGVGKVTAYIVKI